MKLRREQRQTAREVARDLWIKFAGDVGKCRRAFRKDPRIVGFDIALMIQVAIALWRLWKAWNMSEPPIVATQAEAPALGNDFFE